MHRLYFLILSTDPLERVFVDLSPHLVQTWERIGIHLNVPQSTMNSIKSVPMKSHDECAKEVLDQWSTGPHRDDVKMLKKALLSLKRNDLAKQVDKYLSKYFVSIL